MPEPVTVAEAKFAAKQSLDTDAPLDALVASLIVTARQSAETITGRLYHDAEVVERLTDWPAAGRRLYVNAPRAVAISYWDGAVWQSLAPSAFAWADDGSGTVLAPALGTCWPVLGQVAVGERVRITITAGPADPPATVPECVKQYIKAVVTAWLDHPEAVQRGELRAHPQLAGLLAGELLLS